VALDFFAYRNSGLYNKVILGKYWVLLQLAYTIDKYSNVINLKSLWKVVNDYR